MLTTRYEEYNPLVDGLPFVLQVDLKRSRFQRSESNNWHANLEIQICTEGCGTVLLDSERHPFNKNDIITVNSNALHYTGTDTDLTYTCLIVSTDFCKKVGIDPSTVRFEPLIKSASLVHLFEELTKIYLDHECPCRIAKLNKIVLEMLIELAEQYITHKTAPSEDFKRYETVKNVISYIRENYRRKITIDDISKAVLYDKYALCREFKRLTGQTIVENLNNYRCIKAIDYLSEGYSVADTASLCGFDNLSFFAKTFKRYIGKLPREYKKQKI